MSVSIGEVRSQIYTCSHNCLTVSGTGSYWRLGFLVPRILVVSSNGVGPGENAMVLSVLSQGKVNKMG